MPQWSSGRASAALVALVGVLSGPLAGAAVPLEVYGRLPQIEDVSLSPDGSQIAFVRTQGDERIVWFGPLADPKKALPIRVGDEKLRGIRWADESHVLLYLSAALHTFDPGAGVLFLGSELAQLQVLDVRTRKTTIVPSVDGIAKGSGPRWLNLISGTATVRYLGGHTVLFLRGDTASYPVVPVLFRLDLTTGLQRIVSEGDETTVGWMVGADGEIVAEEEYFGRQQQWNLQARLDGQDKLTEVATGRERIDLPELLGFGSEPDTVLIQQLEDGKDVWKLLSLHDGKMGPPLGQGATYRAAIEDTVRGRLIGGVEGGDYPHYVFFDPDIQMRWDEIVAAFPGEQVGFVSDSEDRTKFVVLVQGAKHGFAYFFVDLQTGHASMIGQAYEGVTRPLEVRRISYAAQDGFVVPAYLTLPAGRAETKLPLIVLPHGGPAVSDNAEFDWWSQALADQGYAVLRPNYRGSDLGRSFLEAGYGQWGRKMQTDLSDGVRYLAKEGIIDPARVCIVGGSYGGYAALAGVTLDPGVYRCAVSVAGLSDLKRFLNRKGWGRTQRYWDRFMGVSGQGDTTLDAISPIKHIDAITVPVLLIHGRDDAVVPFEQSQVMLDAMKRANKDVELVTLKREDHWLSRSETRLQMLQASVQFLRAHNPPD